MSRVPASHLAYDDEPVPDGEQFFNWLDATPCTAAEAAESTQTEQADGKEDPADIANDEAARLQD